ncbi:unnamed protein product [Ectocarpus sp. 6 AP-2014]
MPGLVFRQRRLLLGGDELMLPYATSACGRAVWMVFLLVGLALASGMLLGGDCHDVGYVVFVYEALSIVAGILSLVVECQIAKAATYGTIIDPGPRNKLLERHLSRKTALGVTQLVLALFGTFLIFYVPFAYACRGDSSIALVTTGIVLTSISQYLDSGGMYCCFLAFTTADSIWIHDDDDEDGGVAPRHGLLSEMEKKYESFCRSAVKVLAWCSCAFNVFGGGEQEADFAHVSRVFGRMLSARRYVDVVATDVAAGLILLRHVQKAEDYKRRDNLRGGSGKASFSTPVTNEPSHTDVVGSDAPRSANATLSSSSRGTAAAERSAAADAYQGGEGTSMEGSGLVGKAGGGGGGGRRRRRRLPGRVPLSERPQEHRKYYKVSPDESVLDLTDGGEDWRVLQEVAHFISYANVMYSVWGTLIIDPWSGLRRIIRRSGSWCPKFISRRGARHRESLFRADSSTSRLTTGRSSSAGSLKSSSKHSSSRIGGGGIGRGSRSISYVQADGGGDANDNAERGAGAAGLPSLCEAEIRGDNWWGSHETALRSELPDGAELVLAHFNNCLDETPYCVVVDHTWQSIIITIRGTHSFEDFLVDAMAEPQSLENVGLEWGFDGRNMHAHQGILRRAEWIRRDLETSGVLHLLLGTAPTGGGGGGGGPAGGEGRGGSGRWEKGTSMRTRDGVRFSSLAPLASAIGGSGFCSGYTVRAVGHSLGGGVAALLALLMTPVYPGVKALAVSPPGGLVSEGACREARTYATETMVTSVVLNDDVVPRMSAQSIELLADQQVLEVIGRSRVSKLFVMRSLLLTDEEAHRPERYLEVPDEPAAEGLEGVTQNAEEAAEGVQEQLAVPLVGGRRPSDTSRMEAGGFGGSERRVSTGKGEGGGARVSGGDEEGAGDEELRYHRQLRRYREHLQQERGSRQHLHRLRLPGRILHLVNTDFVTEKVTTEACENGCLWSCCSAFSPLRTEDEVSACCCTPGIGERRKRVFTPVWSSPNDLGEIRVTPAFLVDHSPDEILKAVDETVRDLGIDT